MNEFKKEKFKQILHYVIYKCGNLSNVGRTVLYKLLYFSDFDYYELFEEKMTGESYYKLDHGPAPSHFDEVTKELEKEGNIEKISSEYYGYEQQKFVSKKDPDVSLLTGKELLHIQNTIGKYCHMNASQIRGISHCDLPYKATEINEEIDYELVFYRDESFSVRTYPDD